MTASMNAQKKWNKLPNELCGDPITIIEVPYTPKHNSLAYIFSLDMAKFPFKKLMISLIKLLEPVSPSIFSKANK
jgi:hypothetical protein